MLLANRIRIGDGRREQHHQYAEDATTRILERHAAEVVRNNMRQFFHPEARDLVQYHALAGYRSRHDHIKRGNPVGGHDQHMAVIDIIDVADLALVQ